MSTTLDKPLPDATRLAVDRTRLAHDRTLMAWIRTAASLISFGFTIYKFFQQLRAQQPPVANGTLIGPAEFALILISAGVISLVLATVEHRRSMVMLRSQYGHDIVPRSMTTVVAAFIGILGILGLGAVLFRW
jgi:putative membrane protein